MKKNYKSKELRVHFIGIGGIGMSALAKFYLSNKAKISGSDLELSEISLDLKKMGVNIIQGHYALNMPKNCDLVIYNAAIDKKNPELLAAKKTAKKIMLYSEAIGELTKKYFTVAVAGAHGKSTTTAMIAKIMIDAGLDPTVIIGTKLKEFSNQSSNITEGSNFRMGSSKYFVVEADEYAASFLKYYPDIAVINNIDKEHLDYYGTLDKIRQAFKKFMLNTKKGGFLVLNNDNKIVLDLGLELYKKNRFIDKIKWYSLRNKNVDKIKNILQIPGSHNVYNALAACRVGEILNITLESSLKSLSEYGGAWRRFEYRGSLNGAKVFDDYAHHPTEIKATLQAARSVFPNAKIWCVFQPHQRERLINLFNDFITAFDAANEVIILNTYEVKGRESPINAAIEKQSFFLAQKIGSRLKSNVHYIEYKPELIDFLKKHILPGDIVIMMGAGDIWKITKELI